MKHEEVNEIIECLGGEKKIFGYFKDRYCLDAIEYEMSKKDDKKIKVSDLKSGVLKRYAQKPIIKNGLKYFGDGQLTCSDIQLFQPIDKTEFVQSLGVWGSGDRGHDQTTRNQSNLVLQLGFDNQHMKHYQQLIKPTYLRGPFEYWGHPVSRGKRKTLSWVRMDVSFETDEVLIEEVQNDWLRRASSILARARRRQARNPSMKLRNPVPYSDADFESLERYVDTVLEPYQKIWAEASLTAALCFIRKELGINNVFYHSFDTGIKIKQVVGKPPRSMYTKLPKQFGFELVNQAPDFLMKDKTARRYLQAINKKQSAQWHRLV